MSVFDQILDSGPEAERDRVLNSETRRALTRIANLISTALIGLLVAVAILSLPALTAIFLVAWQLHLMVTVGVAVALPAVVPYVMLRMLGLSHRDVLYVGKQAYREAVTEIIALSGTQETADVFTEGIAIGEDTENSLTEEVDATESSTEVENRSSNANEAADTATGPETASQ